MMGIWNAHTSVGNIIGTVVSAALLSWVGVGGVALRVGVGRGRG